MYVYQCSVCKIVLILEQIIATAVSHPVKDFSKWNKVSADSSRSRIKVTEKYQESHTKKMVRSASIKQERECIKCGSGGNIWPPTVGG